MRVCSRFSGVYPHILSAAYFTINIASSNDRALYLLANTRYFCLLQTFKYKTNSQLTA